MAAPGLTLLPLAGRAGAIHGGRDVDLRVRAIANTRGMALDDRRIPLHAWRRELNGGEPLDLDAFAAHVQTEHLPHAVIVDCTADERIARRYGDWLRRGIHVVTPNKRANTLDLPYYQELRRLGGGTGAHYLYETTVGAGLPIIQTLRDLIDMTSRDAVRFFLVSRKADTEFVFDVDLALKRNDENPVFYVQYAHARICSVIAKGGGFDAVLFTSSSTVRNLVGIAGKPHNVTVIAVIGPQTAKTAEEFGLRVDVMADKPSASALAAALAEYGAKQRQAALAAGDVVVRVHYSDINYKDALAAMVTVQSQALSVGKPRKRAPEQHAIDRIGGLPSGISAKDWPQIDDQPAGFLVQIDTSGILRKHAGVAVFCATDGSATEDEESNTVVLLKPNKWAKGSPRGCARRCGPAEGAPADPRQAQARDHRAARAGPRRGRPRAGRGRRALRSWQAGLRRSALLEDRRPAAVGAGRGGRRR